MGIIKDNLSPLAETVAGKPGKLVVEISDAIIDTMIAERTSYKQKMKRLCNYNIMGGQYTEEILKYFVKRDFVYYGTKNRVSINKIKSVIERQKLARNVILTGPAGSGKTTALKWLYINSYVKGFSFVYIYSRMFDECESLQEALDAISEAISHTDQCIVFFDGLDELKCIKGTDAEFQKLVDFFNKMSRQSEMGDHCHRFVISTRPEHFSFHKMIKKGFIERNFDNYVVFELQRLTPVETLKICKTMEKLSKYDHKEGYEHFVNKWPTSGKNKADTSKNEVDMSKAQYLRLLKKYLKVTKPEQSLLALPLFCRYAYPIICVWNLQDDADKECTSNHESAQIRRALEYYIKWEFHDTHECPTFGGAGKAALANYQHKVWGFLTEIAGIMGTDDYIGKSQWEKLRRAKKISGNISFCALQEYTDDYMAFSHPLFKDCFLASYCVKVVERNAKKQNLLQEKDAVQLAQMLDSSSTIPILYAEQLLNCKHASVKTICKFLFEKAANKDLNYFAKFASGQVWYTYTPDAPFTVEEYLVVFPLGTVRYHNITFSAPVLRQLYTTGILEVEDADSCLGCDTSRISQSLNIKGVKSSSTFGTGFKHIVREFKIVCNGDFVDVGGFWHTTTTKKELEDILLHSDLHHLISGMSHSISEIQHNEIIKIALLRKRIKDAQRRQEERNTLLSWMKSIINFIGEQKNYWCLFDKDSLYVLQMTPENEPLMTELFCYGLSQNTFDYISFCGEYKAITESIDILTQKEGICKVSDISVKFNSNIERLEQGNDALRTYYKIHWKNLQLFKKNSKRKENFFNNDINDILEIHEILDFYEQADHFLEQFPNEKLALYLSDEKLFTFYIFGDGDQMVDLAKETLDLCKKYQHQNGQWLRELLLSDDMRFAGEDFGKIYAYAREYIFL